METKNIGVFRSSPYEVMPANIEQPQPDPVKVVSNSGGQTSAMLAHSELIRQINQGNYDLQFCERLNGIIPSGATVTPKR